MAGEGGQNKTTWTLLFWLFIQILMIMVLVPATWLYDVVKKEDAMLREDLGPEAHTYIETLGYDIYSTIFLETGFNDYMSDVFFPTESERAASIGMQDMGSTTWWPWLEGRADAMVFLLIQLCERLAHLWMWVPYAAILVIPAIWDGYNTWKIRQTTFDYTSPFWHRFSVNTATMIFLIVTIGFFMPIPFHPYIIPVLIVFILPSLVIALMANLPKKI